MENFDPSERIQVELDVELKRRYPNFHKEENEIKSESERTYRVINHSKKNSVIQASIEFYQGQKNFSAVFEYRTKSQPNGREFYWFCVRDWKD